MGKENTKKKRFNEREKYKNISCALVCCAVCVCDLFRVALLFIIIIMKIKNKF